MQDEFGAHTENRALLSQIRAEIASLGPMSFRRFMELALYQPVHGYYAASAEVIGPAGDYLTSPEVSPLFGAMIGRQVADVWRLLGEPSDFTIVEPGAGNGTMALDLLLWVERAEPALRRLLRYVLVERLERQRHRQQRLLQGQAGISWSEGLPPAVHGCVVSNELLDALPVHLVRGRAGGIDEAFVISGPAGLSLTWLPPASAELTAYFEPLGCLPAPGALAEVNLAARDWMHQAAATLERGLLLTLDYGYPARQLYAPWRRQGTLMCFYRHTPGDAPLERVGRQDITAHIDFTTLARAGIDAGLAPAGFLSQRELLTNLGIHEALAIAPGEELFSRRRAVEALTESSGLGRVRTLALTRGLDGCLLRGFAECSDPRQVLFGHGEAI